MISHRVADNPLGPLKDDLLLALQRIRHGLDTYRENPADFAPLEAAIDAIDQIRSPLAALEHRQAVALLDEMRLLCLGLVKGKLKLADPTVLRQATTQLGLYLESCLAPGQRRPDPELARALEQLRQVRQQNPATADGASRRMIAPDTARHGILDALERLRERVAGELEGAAEQPRAWRALESELQALRRRLAERALARPAALTERLERVAAALAVGAEHYRPLATGMVGEVLASLGHYLEPVGSDRPASAAVLKAAEDHLAPLETLLALPPPPESADASPASPPPGPDDLGADLLSMPWPSSAPSETADGPASASPSPDRAWPSPAPSRAPTPSAVELDFSSPAPPETDAELAATGDMSGLLDLMGLAEADPEFVDVFLEEARGELDTIREQLARWREDLSDREALTTIRRAFHTLKGSGRMVGAVVIGDFAWEYENLLNQILSGTLSANPLVCDAVAAAVAALAPLVGEAPLRGGELDALPPLVARAQVLARPEEVEPVTAPPSIRVEPAASERLAEPPSRRLAPTEVEPVTAPPVPVEPASLRVAAEVDPEFVEVFLEEAREELDRIGEQRSVWLRNPADRQAITAIRRAFHTLKGSGRVVGATEIGDFAWVIEDLLNQVLSGALAASPGIIELVGEAATALEPLVGKAPSTGDTGPVLAALVERARELARAVPAIAPAETPEVAEPAEPTAAAPVEAALPPPVEAARPVPAVPPTLPEPATPAGVDLELAQVFQYEATEILDASDLILQRLASEPDQAALLNDLRRSMHTLKGSSRMSGFMPIGDLAHAAESVLDALGKSKGRATSVVLDTLQHTLDHLNRMLAETAGGASPPAAVNLIGDLHRLAEALAAGEPVTKLPPVVAAAEPTSRRQPVTPLPELAPFQMTELDQELVQVFQVEAGEILDSSDVILQRLREDAGNVELLNDLRREMHTLKGSSRMAGFMTVGDLAHAAESLLDALGKGALKGSAQILDHIQRALDRLHQMLAGVLGGVQPPAQRELIEELQAALGAKAIPERSRPLLPAVTATLTAAAAAAAARPTEKPAPAAASADSIRVSAALLNTLVNQMGESSIFRARIDQGVGAMSFNLGELEQTIARLRRQVTNLATQAEARIQSRQDHGAKAHQLEFDPLELDRFTELQQVSRSLMEIADDLGNIGNSLGEHAREVTTLLDQQGKVNKEIQQGLMRTGMVRFGSIVPRLRRVVRQSSQELGKRAELLVGGEDAEVDRNVLENMVAPLEHMLRNSLAHGIEAPERRRTAGKPEIGTITLSLRREGAELVLELGDDGGGLNFEAIRVKGEEKGLLLPDQPTTQEELIALLLRPGFSTATSVTQISGRGVGMDVVNEAIRAMRGALLIQTEPGQGTRFIIRLPFSLAVTQALLARAGDSLFAIPLLSIELVTRLKESEFQSYLAGDPVQHRHNERGYPIHNLGILIGSAQIQPFEEVADRRPPTLLFRSAEASAALQVEAVLGNREIIVKPVGPQFNGVPGISGATVLGDGRVVVVLELAALVRHIGSQAQKQAESRALRMARQETRPEKISVMVIDDSITMRKVTARILERHNIQVMTAKDGLDAVAMLQTQVPDLAILDIEMPRMDGFEVVAHVRNQQALRGLPIIMVTSRGGEKHRERAMKLGVNDYLTKPYQEEQLMQSIRRILGDRAQEMIT